MFKKLFPLVVALSGATLAPAVAFADTPGATAVTAVTAAQADGLLVAGALTGMAIAVWAALYIKRKFFGS